MKRTILLLAIAVTLAAFAAPVLAQTKECNDENKAAWYQKFLDNRKGEAPQQKIAYENANEYLRCTTDKTEQIAVYLQKWVGEYDKLTGTQAVAQQFEEAYKQKKYADQIRLGKQVLASDPESTPVFIIMGLAGLGDAAVLNDSAEYAKKAITMLEAGKPFAPLASKDQALAYLNYLVGKASLKNAPADAIPYLLKAARFESDLKKTWQLYYDLATAYGEGPRAKLTNDYKPFVGQTETPESKLILANLNQVIDRQIDALARAAALVDAANKKDIMADLTDLYKYRNKSETGLNELVAGVLAKPIPDIPTPLTSLPTPPPTSTPATSGPTTSGAAQNGTTGSAKPTASPTPTPKKPRS